MKEIKGILEELLKIEVKQAFSSNNGRLKWPESRRKTVTKELPSSVSVLLLIGRSLQLLLLRPDREGERKKEVSSAGMVVPRRKEQKEARKRRKKIAKERKKNSPGEEEGKGGSRAPHVTSPKLEKIHF